MDGLTAIRSLQPKKKWVKGLLQFINPPQDSKAIKVGLINDTYKDNSIKGGTREERGESGVKVQIDGFDQHMLQGSKWQEFLSSGYNKEELLRLILRYLETTKGMMQLKHPHIFTAGNTTYLLRDGRFSVLHNCNHEEADTRLVLHALLADSDVVVVAKDTDVLILLIWAYERKNVGKRWYMKYDHNKYADIGKICKFLGRKICLNMPAMHAVTGCDTTSYLYKVGQVRVMKKLLEADRKCELLADLGKDESFSEITLKNAKEFIRTLMYTGKQKETYVETRIRRYQEMKVKSSMSLPPDPDSVTQVIKGAHYQVYFWKRCDEINIEIIPFANYGWRWCKKQKLVVPIWFTGDQLPPSLQKKRHKNANKADEADDEDANERDQPKR